MEKPYIVKIVWKDAWADATEPVNLEEAHMKHAPMIMTTLGWLLYEDSIGVSVANEQYWDDGGLETYRGRTFIPREMIQEIVPMVKPRKSRKPPPTEPT